MNAASPGDTVQIPAGNAVWNGTLTVAKDIQLVGAGIGQTVITNNVAQSFNSGSLIQWQTLSNGFCRLSGLDFQAGPPDAVNNTSCRFIVFSGNCHAIRVDHCNFNLINIGNLEFYGWTYGVIDHCNFYVNNATAINVDPDNFGNAPYGDVSWATPDDWGSTNAICIENCNFTAAVAPGDGALDSCYGARVVVRYNNFTNCPIGSHGTESTGRARSLRWYDIYMNNFQWPTNGNSTFWLAIYLRGGTANIWSNTIYGGWQSMVHLANYRDNPHVFTAWSNVTGENPWDSNNATLFSSGAATSSTGAGTLIDSSKNWTAGQWANSPFAYFLFDIPAGVGAEIQGNTANTITFNSYNPYGANLSFNIGDSYRIRQVYAALDQCGFGQGDLIAGDTPINTRTGTAAWPNEASDPIYEWGNNWKFLVNGYSSQLVACDSTVIVGSRDVKDGVARPGYTPLVYPHPLVSGTATNLPAGPTIYTLTVTSGTGSGSYTNGATVNVSATVAPGSRFTYWSGNTSVLANTNSSSTQVTMPATNVAVTANFIVTNYSLTVNNGTGGGSYTYGTAVAVAADTVSGQSFAYWSGDTAYLSSTNSSQVTVTMPAANIALTANYTAVVTNTSTSADGSGTVTTTNGTYSTSFPLTENPLSENGMWIDGQTGIDWSNCQSVAGMVMGTQTGTETGDYEYGDSTAMLAGNWNPDQSVTATVKIADTDSAQFEEVELRLRTTIANHSITCYECYIPVKPTGDGPQIVLWNGPLASYNVLAGTSGYAVNGDVIKAAITNNVITVWKNGTQIMSYTDNTLKTGNPGIGFWVHNGASGDSAHFGFSSITATGLIGASGSSVTNSILTPPQFDF